MNVRKVWEKHFKIGILYCIYLNSLIETHVFFKFISNMLFFVFPLLSFPFPVLPLFKELTELLRDPNRKRETLKLGCIKRL